MSTLPNRSSLTPSRAVELVQKLIEKTKQQKVLWKVIGTALVASISEDVEARFLFARGSTGELEWSRFVVRSKGDVILEYENPSGFNALIAAAMASSNPLISAIHNLFWLVARVADAGLERAINALDAL